MKRSTLRKLQAGVMAAACTVLAAGCSVEAWTPGGGEVAVNTEPGIVYADTAPPAPLVDEEVGVAPGPGYVWIGGGWVWGGRDWNWNGGHWSQPPHAGARWVPNHYGYSHGRHTFTKGHWH